MLIFELMDGGDLLSYLIKQAPNGGDVSRGRCAVSVHSVSQYDRTTSIVTEI